MVKFIFNNKNYNIDDSAIAPAMTALEAHLSSMAGGGEPDVPDYPEASEGLEYTLNDDGQSYSASGIGECTDTDIVIAHEYQGLPVTSIDTQAFIAKKNLTSVTIPDSVTSINMDAFYMCSGLTNVVIPESVTNIGTSAFGFCSGLESVVIYGRIPSIVTYTFMDCNNLKRVTIPNSVTKIDSTAFKNCTGLQEIYYEGTEEEWNQINGSSNQWLINVTKHYNYVQEN